jgi:acyl-CoA synthetase (AMP-forming)/AMP-acid ligase II
MFAMIIPDTIYNTVKLYPDKLAVAGPDGRYTYSEIKLRIDKLANALHASGLNKGDAIGAILWNCCAFYELYYAAAQLGLVFVPLNTRLSYRELEYMVSDSEVKILVTDYEFKDIAAKLLANASSLHKIIWVHAPADITHDEANCYYAELFENDGNLKHIAPGVCPEDIAQIYYTSGSTGMPKGVIMTHHNMVSHAVGTLWEYNLTDQDIWIHCVPMFHMSDACNTWAVTLAGGTHILPGKFTADKVLEYVEKEQVTILKMVPTMWELMLNDPNVGDMDISSVRLALSGGSPVSPELVKRILDAFGCEYYQGYGMTETTHFLTLSKLKSKIKKMPKEDQLKYMASAGRPFYGVKIRVVDEAGKDVANDGKQVGEIIARGDIITPGYWNNPEENQRSFKAGWLYTGDLATIDCEGYIFIVDRKKDMIISGGENIYSIEVEHVLSMHPDILESVVIGVSDPKWGEAVRGICKKISGGKVTEDQLIAFCKNNLSRYKAPKSIVFVKDIPKTGSGKKDKKTIREKYS